MGFSSAHMMRGGLAGDAQTKLRKACHALAIEKGLPEIEGFYGLDQNGEFVTV